jgi:uncharacterized peroxidase-related enzyme
MARIKTISYDEADDKLKKILEEVRANYPKEYDPPYPDIPGLDESIIESHSLIPDALHHSFMALAAMMRPELPLVRREHELIASMVSLTNGCYYCRESHLDFLRKVTLDDELIEALREDYTKAPISDREKVMLDYVVQLTKAAYKITPAYHERLRAVGFDDTGILQITLIASWFNYINRVADSLGVGRDKLEDTAIAAAE